LQRNGEPVKATLRVPFDFYFSGRAEEAEPPKDAAKGPLADGTQRVWLNVVDGMLIHRVAPVYPREAKLRRIQGDVVLQAVISKEGWIKDLLLISGHPLLVPAAMGAVEQWRYKPYLLNGEPVEVDTHVTVHFQLR
jgi:protein TonB